MSTAAAKPARPTSEVVRDVTPPPAPAAAAAAAEVTTGSGTIDSNGPAAPAKEAPAAASPEPAATAAALAPAPAVPAEALDATPAAGTAPKPTDTAEAAAPSPSPVPAPAVAPVASMPAPAAPPVPVPAVAMPVTSVPSVATGAPAAPAAQPAHTSRIGALAGRKVRRGLVKAADPAPSSPVIVPVPVAPASNGIICVAGCGKSTGPSPRQNTAPGRLVPTAQSATVPAPDAAAPAAPAAGIECVAGCYGRKPAVVPPPGKQVAGPAPAAAAEGPGNRIATHGAVDFAPNWRPGTGLCVANCSPAERERTRLVLASAPTLSHSGFALPVGMVGLALPVSNGSAARQGALEQTSGESRAPLPAILSRRDEPIDMPRRAPTGPGRGGR